MLEDKNVNLRVREKDDTPLARTVRGDVVYSRSAATRLVSRDAPQWFPVSLCCLFGNFECCLHDGQT